MTYLEAETDASAPVLGHFGTCSGKKSKFVPKSSSFGK